jgi:hypothetical protein
MLFGWAHRQDRVFDGCESQGGYTGNNLSRQGSFFKQVCESAMRDWWLHWLVG